MIMVEKRIVPMQFHPRAFSAFGSDLVTNDFVAVNELVKNSYDAYAYNVQLSINQDNKGNAYIEIVDDGMGMTQKIIEEAWAVIATPYKKKNPLVTRDGKVRIVSGNKGLGRLSSARLGNSLEILTKNLNDECVLVKIDWNSMIESNDISSCGITIESGNEEYLQKRIKNDLNSVSDTGTILCIRELNAEWDEKKISELRQGLARLISPFEDVSDFNIFVGQEGHSPIQIVAHEFINKPTYHLWGEVDRNGKTRWKYTFNSEKIQNDEGEFTWEEAFGGFDHIAMNAQLREKKLPEYSCGEFSFELRAWDLDADSIGGISDQFNIKRNEIRKTISTYKGISIYRDSVLVLPKSDTAKDWLGVDLRRVSNIGRRISTNQIIGRVSISEEKNPELRDTTDREKLVDTVEYGQFCDILETVISQLENLRNRDRVVAKKVGKIVDLLNPIDPGELGSKVEDLVKKGKNEDVINLVQEYSANAEKSIGELKDRMEYYAQTASLGSIAFVIMHEIRTGMMVIRRFSKWVKENLKLSNPIGQELCEDSLNAHARLMDVADSFAPLYKKDYFKEKARVPLDDAVNHSIRLIMAKYESKGIIIDYCGYSDYVIGMHIGELQTIILNLLDNACYWLEYVNGKKHICITAAEKNNKILLNVSDNGPGIPVDKVEKIFMPGITGKKSNGIGMGLVIVTELLSHYDCKVETCIPGDIGGATFILELPLERKTKN